MTGEFEFAGCASFDLKEMDDFGHLEVRRDGRIFDFAVIGDGGPDDGSRFSMDVEYVRMMIRTLASLVADWDDIHGEMCGVLDSVSDFLTDRGYNDEEDDGWDISDYVHNAIFHGDGMEYIHIRDLLIKERNRDLLRDFVDICHRWESEDHEGELDFMMGIGRDGQ